MAPEVVNQGWEAKPRTTFLQPFHRMEDHTQGQNARDRRTEFTKKVEEETMRECTFEPNTKSKQSRQLIQQIIDEEDSIIIGHDY